MGLIMGIECITLRASQVVTGVAITLFGIGISIFWNKIIFGLKGASVTSFPHIGIPFLTSIPFLGPVLFQQNVLSYLSYVLVPVSAIILFRTTLGLKIEAVGENPAAADVAGINVFRIRYLCVILGGAMAGLAGAYLSLGYVGLFTENMTAGRGWIAVVVVIFGRWNPYRVLGGAMLFGVVDALQLHLQQVGTGLPVQALNMFPYITAIVVLLLVYKKQKPPAALTVPYTRE